MTDFKNIKTRYVRNKLKGLDYNEENAKYIQDLMFLERVISGEKINYIAGMSYESKKREYSSEFKEIYTEIDPEGYRKYLQELEQQKIEREEREKQRVIQDELEEELSRKSWGEISRE